jgi:transcriptional regulator with XRE-family HTH domain
MERVNPLKRIRKNLNYSLDRLSNEHGISRQLIINNENGQYANPSPALLAALDIDTQVEERRILAEYHLWQKETRVNNFGVLVNPLPLIYAGNPGVAHPVVNWAEHSNIPYTRIAKLYCVHQGLMDRLKNQPNLMNYLPTAFTDALIDSGYSFDLVNELESRFQAYKHNIRCKVLSKNAP